jgi:hypothetical protein
VRTPITPTAPRVVLLGASNLTRAISTVVGLATQRAGGPARIEVAMGHGRSYGCRSRVLARSLPGIDECGLWPLAAAAGPTFALVTDIGNDIAYGHDPATIEGWVDRCLDRLAAHGASIIMTRPPAEPIRRLPAWQFRVVSRLLFPAHDLTFRTAVDRVIELDDRIRALGARRGVVTIEMDPDWYGIDPVHLRRGCWREAWGRILEPWPLPAPGPPPRPSLVRWARLRTATPERWWLLGRARGRRQPAARLAGGTTVALY